MISLNPSFAHLGFSHFLLVYKASVDNQSVLDIMYKGEAAHSQKMWDDKRQANLIYRKIGCIVHLLFVTFP